MLVSEVKKLSPEDRLLYWIQERESIRLKKDTGEPRPWTDDEILQRYRFTCVRRMDDNVSKWLLKNWYEPNFGHKNMLAACTLARHFNLPSALEQITDFVFGDVYQPLKIKQVLRSIKSAGGRIFSGAYMIRGISGVDKTEMVVSRVCQPLKDNPPCLDTNSIQACVEALLSYWGFSTFMAGQVAADLRWAISGNWKDRFSWAPIGPGSLRGMNRLHDRPARQPLKQVQFLEELGRVIGICRGHLHRSITSRLEAMDYQNCLCEYYKYVRTLLGEGKPKRLYR